MKVIGFAQTHEWTISIFWNGTLEYHDVKGSYGEETYAIGEHLPHRLSNVENLDYEGSSMFADASPTSQ